MTFLKSKSSTLTYFILFLVSALVLIGCKDEKKNDDVPLAVVLSADYPPFEFYKDNKIVGFEVDLITTIATKLGRTVSVKDASFDSLIGSLQSKRADLSISALSATSERKVNIDFSIPYHISQSVIITLRNDLKTIDSFKNKSIGVQTGSSYEPYLKQNAKENNYKIQSLTKIPDLVQALKTKRIDGVILGISEAESLKKQFSDLHIVEVPDTKIEYAIAFPKNSPLLAPINEIIKQMEQDGSIADLCKRWFTDLEKIK